MSISIFDDKQIDLDLNGPILSFTTNPTGVGSTGVGINSTGGGTVSLTGIATATFPTSADNAGYVTYRWYEQGVGALSDGTYITGTATTTLTSGTTRGVAFVTATVDNVSATTSVPII